MVIKAIGNGPGAVGLNGHYRCARRRSRCDGAGVLVRHLDWGCWGPSTKVVVAVGNFKWASCGRTVAGLVRCPLLAPWSGAAVGAAVRNLGLESMGRLFPHGASCLESIDGRALA